MTLSNSPLSFSDCYEVFDEAIESPRGVRLQMKDMDAAIYFRMRMHHARNIQRKENRMTYEEDHPLHGRSVYDQIVLRIRQRDGSAWLYLEKNQSVVGKVQLIPDEEPIGKPERQPEMAMAMAEPERRVIPGLRRL